MPLFIRGTMTRRIKKDLKEFFDKQSLTDAEKSFIVGCMLAQNNHPQLTNKQWKIVTDIEKRYRDGKGVGCKENF
jgi:hypothetical protein